MNKISPDSMPNPRFGALGQFGRAAWWFVSRIGVLCWAVGVALINFISGDNSPG